MPASGDLDEQFSRAFSELKSSETTRCENAPMLEKELQREVDKCQYDIPDADCLSAMMDKLLKIPEDDENPSLQDTDLIVDQLMDEIICGEILAKPFEELSEKYSKFIADNLKGLDAAVAEKYSRQASIVKSINLIFQRPDYQTQAKHYQREVLDLLDQLQLSGDPPSEVMDNPDHTNPAECGIM